MELAPVVLFVYNRPLHTQKVVEALQRNELASESDLIIFSDAPKTGSEVKAVAVVRNYIRQIKDFRSVKVVARDRNFGLAESVITGVTDVVNPYGKIIVIEDDLVTSPYFLHYMNAALHLYEQEEAVISIHGYFYPVKNTYQLPETFFLKGADCWGWGTWKRGWDEFEPDGRNLLKEIRQKKAEKAFNYNSAFNYSKMLSDQVRGKNDSWAIRWYASAFLKNRLTLYPGKSLVQNIGIDQSGTHCNWSNHFKIDKIAHRIAVGKIPVEPNELAFKAVEEFFRATRPSVFQSIVNRLRKYTEKRTSRNPNPDKSKPNSD